MQLLSCTRYGFNVSACKDIDCSGHGTCIEEKGDVFCRCDDGFSAQGLTCVAINLKSCEDAGDCNDQNDCTEDSCNNDGYCIHTPIADGTSCEDGSACSSSDSCLAGMCIAGTTDKDSDGDGYYDAECSGGDDCDDSNKEINPNAAEGPLGGPTCTDQKDNDCDGAVDDFDTGCISCKTDANCDDKNPCTNDSCLPSGNCENLAVANGQDCDDNDACTQSDSCQAGKCVGSDPITCTALDDCHTIGICDAKTGNCSNPPKTDGISCDDANACTQSDSCQAGVCTGANPVICTALDSCHAIGVCDKQTGICSNPAAADGTSCDDGNACTQTDSCQTGVCSGSNPVVCTALDQCHRVGICDTNTGVCDNPLKADGSGCEDGNFCTLTDTCQAGVCVGGSAKVCTSTNSCQNGGTCEPSTGLCSGTNKPNGTSCDDGDACTQSDSCQNGTCTGTNPVVCTALDQCHDVGSCNPLTGLCSDPQKSNGASCNDGNACTQTDTCQSGSCVGGNLVVCTALDQCHNAGVCNTTTGGCSDPIKTNGTSCNDSNACTQTDTCQNGTCTGANPITCSALDQCHNIGTCNTSTGVCSNPIKSNGSNCNDGNACTQTDTCQSGSCTGNNPVTCTALDNCHNVGTCNTSTGICSNPIKTNGTSCSNGLYCDGAETCQNGVCTDQTDPCTAGETCNESTDTCVPITSSLICIGGEHSCATTSTGSMKCFGLNEDGQVGNNSASTPNQLNPISVTGLTSGVSSCSTSYRHSCASTSSGYAYCWGRNEYGVFGNNTKISSTTPVQVSNLNNISHISAGAYHVCARRDDGTAWCWGRNAAGRLGDGTTTERLTPRQVVGVGGSGYLTNVTEISAGESHSCALKSGNVYCWGRNNRGQLGKDPGLFSSSSTPVLVSGLSNVAQVNAGYESSCARTSSGEVYCWGNNDNGILGDNTSIQRNAPVQVRGLNNSGYLTNATDLYHNLREFNCVTVSGGYAYCWGLNTHSQLGDGSTATRRYPVQVQGPGGSGYLTNVKRIVGAWHYTCAIKTDHSVWCWGVGYYGNLGDGTTNSSTSPTQSNM